jgi:hypothetical protein
VKSDRTGSGVLSSSHLITFERLQEADLILDAMYGGGSKGNPA